MNLYDPLYVARPVVEPELFASLRPVAYSGGLGDDQALAKKPTEALDRPADGRRMRGEAKEKAEQAGKGGLPGGGPGGGFGGDTKKRLDERMDLGGQGGQSMASAAKLGDFFQYSIDKPVSLARQK